MKLMLLVKVFTLADHIIMEILLLAKEIQDSVVTWVMVVWNTKFVKILKF